MQAKPTGTSGLLCASAPEPDQASQGPDWAVELAQAADPFKGAVVVVVDDNEANVVLLERILHKTGVEHVHPVTDPRQAVDRCLEVGADLVLLDLHMPYLDGFEVMARLHSVLPEDTYLPVIVLTGDSTAATRERALDAGAKDFLTKPFDRLEVVQRARNLLQTRALYQGIRRENRRLAAEVHRRAERQRREEEAHREQQARIRSILRDDALSTVFQPIADLQTGVTVGVEALTRFEAEPRRPPDVWFAEAAAAGLGVDLELAAARAAVARLPELPAGMLLSVNVSPVTALDPRLHETLTAGGIGPRVVLELTEHSRVADWRLLIENLDEMRRHGVRMAVDDAGAGYAGLQQIVSMRPEVIKLDIHLTRGVDEDPVRRALAASMVTFAADTGAVIIAEGIETAGELAALRELGVPWGQGYLLAHPGPLPAPAHIPLPTR